MVVCIKCLNDFPFLCTCPIARPYYHHPQTGISDRAPWTIREHLRKQIVFAVVGLEIGILRGPTLSRERTFLV